MRVLVSGASGFVGRYLVDYLLQVTPGVDIVGTTRQNNVPSWDPRLCLVSCDIAGDGGREIQRLIAAEQPDHVYHLAGISSGAVSDREAVFAINVQGTQNLMRAVDKEASHARCLFASSGYVYGQCDERRPAREVDELRPVGVYAESKRAAEESAHTVGASVARAFNHAGPGQPDAFVVSAFAKQIACIEAGHQPPAIEVGNLEAKRDFLDVRDVVRGYYAILNPANVTQGEASTTYNICRGEACSLHTVLEKLLALSPRSIEVVEDPHRMRPNDFSISVGNPSKLSSDTGWQPKISLSQTLEETLNWWRTNYNHESSI